MKKQLTARQKEILDFILKFIDENGYSPTYREIAAEFNLASTFGVKRHIDALVKKGYLHVGNNLSRSIKPISKTGNNATYGTINIPIVGRVVAGYPVLSEENIEGYLNLDKQLFKSGYSLFALRVWGDSMVEAGILEGDIVLVNKQNTANNGEIVVAMVDGEATLKRFKRLKDEILLIPENKNYSIIRVNFQKDFSIIGKVVSLFRNFN